MADYKPNRIDFEKVGQANPDSDPEEDGETLDYRHDIIVIGTSAGGVDALQRLVRAFRPDLDATVFVVIHTADHSPGLLPEILSAAGPLPATFPEDGMVFERNHIYVAPINQHMLLERMLSG